MSRVGRLGAPTAMACASLVLASCGGLNGENPEPVVEALHREEALNLVMPGAAPIGDVGGFADSGSAVGVQRYASCGPEETAEQYLLGALEPLGWRRVERPSRWVKHVGDREATLYLEFPPMTSAGQCEIAIYADYETGLLGS